MDKVYGSDVNVQIDDDVMTIDAGDTLPLISGSVMTIVPAVYCPGGCGKGVFPVPGTLSEHLSGFICEDCLGSRADEPVTVSAS